MTNLHNLMASTAIRVKPDGEVKRAPEHTSHRTLPAGATAPPGWTFLTGHSRIAGNQGPRMDYWERIEGSLENAILSNPGVYVTMPYCDGGWVVAHRMD